MNATVDGASGDGYNDDPRAGIASAQQGGNQMSYQDPAPQHGAPQQPVYGQPPYGYQPPAPARSGGCLKAALIGIGVIAVLIVALVVLGALMAGDDDENGTGGQADTGQGQDVYAVGETAHTGDFDVTVHSVTDPYVPSNEFDIQPAAGNRFVAVEMTMTSTSTEPQPLSTALGAELTDHLDRLGSFTLAGASELPSLDAPTVAPGEARRGWVVFEVAADATELKLRVKGNLTATGSLFQL